MKHSLILLSLGAAATGCITPEKLETGPTVHVRLEPAGFFSRVTDTDTDPHLTLDPDTNVYEFVLIIETEAGEGEQMGSYTRYPVTDLTGTIETPGVQIPESTYDFNELFKDRTFTRVDPIILPASSLGQALTLHMQATDERGLRSNILDFVVALR